MSLQMLPAGQENTDVQVSWEDQSRINVFSKLNARLSNLEDECQLFRDRKEYLDDVSMEIELVDEDEVLPYKIGDAFYWLKQSEIVELLEKESESTDTRLEELDGKVRSTKSEMDVLKSALYKKFGKAINLEK
ncbi:Prefoldin subunit-domain-containing protein [Lipomyces oligophaga]|uniref:Prefoldin subunit-domain-containing protein n=1 Tax=Lipomyces oligophaga TaxID=45792 RepID=UPI0034CF77BF